MASTLMATKLYIPQPPQRVVVRARLIDRLNEGLHRKLTLISAPAGFGKTTLISAWVAGYQQRAPQVRTAWLSLDEGDNDLGRFLTYLITALRTIAPDLGEGSLSVLQSSQLPPAETILTALVNEIAAIPGHLVLVLDDYHVIDAKPVDDALSFLLEHLPPRLHLAITTREDPQLPLPRLRARDQMTELRASDLRFTLAEAATFLNEAIGLNLSAEDVAALEARTEGWIAGLQLAALSMQSHQDVSAFIRAFAGDHRYIADYLVEEVLQRQPEMVRSFLLQTSILDRLNGSLCDAVTAQEGGSARLEALERGNFFVVPLDDRRQWYRYHHLFTEVLHAHLRAETAKQPGQLAALHLRASEWYARNGSAPDAASQAIRHAVAAEDFERAADLVEWAVSGMRHNSQEAKMFGWLKPLPRDVIRRRPVLCVWYAHVLLAMGEIKGVEDRLLDAEQWLGSSAPTDGAPARPDAPPEGMVVVDKEAFLRLPAEAAVARAGLALALGDVAGAARYARRVLDFVPRDDVLGAGSGAALLGLASWANGDLEMAHRTFAEGMAHLQMAGYLSNAIDGSVALAAIRITQGRLHEAMQTYERGLQLATAGGSALRPPQPGHGVPFGNELDTSQEAPRSRTGSEQVVPGTSVVRGAADMHVGISALYYEHNDLDAARQHLMKSNQLGEHNGYPQNPSRWCMTMARIREAEGDFESALDLLGEAERLYVSNLFPNVRPLPAVKARLWVKKGRLAEALEWARKQGLSSQDDLSYLHEFEHITLARLLLARYKSESTESVLLEAMGLLERLLQAAEEGGRMGSVIGILVLQSIAHHARGDVEAALKPLQRALLLGEPEGYARIFIDEGPAMAALLGAAAKQGIVPDYARRLLAAFAETGQVGDTRDRTPVKQALVEPLSERELEVLRLLRTELTGPEIARELMVSLHTVRTHTNNIYNKLGMNNRRAAVRRAEDLGLL